jgi:hypothetical protein
MKVLSHDVALGPNAQTWILPDLDHSAWAKKIDWYLNYQILRSLPHRPASFTRDLEEVIERSEFDAPMVRLDPESPLLIACENLLPAKQAIVVPVKASTTDWVSSCHKVWVGLGRPAVRIFLPRDVEQNAFAKSWPKQDAGAAVEVILD